MELKGKVAIVTGGGSGIGRATALILAREGSSVAIADINIETANKVAAQVKEQGGRCLAVKTDVSRAQEVNHMVEETVRQFGALDILVNNAGIAPRALLQDLEESTWDRVIEVNLKGTFLCTRAAIRHMIQRKSGRIVNIASGQWFRPGGSSGPAYAASKGGIVSFTKSVALELAPHGINVNVVAPGLTDTPMIRALYATEEAWRVATTSSRLTPPLGKINEPEDIAEAVLFLVKPATRYITGQTLHVNGGSFMW